MMPRQWSVKKSKQTIRSLKLENSTLSQKHGSGFCAGLGLASPEEDGVRLFFVIRQKA